MYDVGWAFRHLCIPLIALPAKHTGSCQSPMPVQAPGASAGNGSSLPPGGPQEEDERKRAIEDMRELFASW